MSLKSDRIAAGAVYADAYANFRSAFVDLAAHDAAMRTLEGPHVPGFGIFPDVIPFRHREFLPDTVGDWSSAVIERFRDIAP